MQEGVVRSGLEKEQGVIFSYATVILHHHTHEEPD